MPRQIHGRRSGALIGLAAIVALLGATLAVLGPDPSPQADAATRWARAARQRGAASERPDDRLTLAAEDPTARALMLPEDTAIAYSTLTGRVHDAHGVGVRGATVELVPPGFLVFFAPSHKLLTGPDGSWTADRVSGGRWRVRAWAHGYLGGKPRIVSIPPSSAVDGIDVRLAADTRISGQLRDADGRTQSGRVVQLEGPSGRRRIDHTDAKGRFAFQRLGPGSWQLTSWPGGEQAVTVAQGQTARVELGLRRVPSLRGRVLRHGVPVPDARVSALLLDVDPHHRRDHDLIIQARPRPDGLLLGELKPGGATTRVRTNGQGEFRLQAHHAPGTYALVASAGGTLTPPVVVHVDWDGEELVDLVFGEGVLSGLVVSALDGRPLPAVKLVATHIALGSRWPAAISANSIFRTQVDSDAAGNFRIEGLAPGRYRVETDGRAYLAQSSPAIEMRRGETPSSVRLELTPGATIRGTVRRAGGKLPSGAIVRLQALGQRRDMRLARVTESGTYQLVGLPAGAYEAVVCGPEPLVEAATIRVAAGAVRQLDFDVTAAPGSAPPPTRGPARRRTGARRR